MAVRKRLRKRTILYYRICLCQNTKQLTHRWPILRRRWRNKPLNPPPAGTMGEENKSTLKRNQPLRRTALGELSSVEIQASNGMLANTFSLKRHQLCFELSGLIVKGCAQIFRDGQEPTIKFGKHCSPKLLNVRFSKARHVEDSLLCSEQIVNQEAVLRCSSPARLLSLAQVQPCDLTSKRRT
jgi:hypothetical protein